MSDDAPMETVWLHPRPPGYGEYIPVNWPKPRTEPEPEMDANHPRNVKSAMIVDFLRDNPGSTAFDVQHATGIKHAYASQCLKYMVDKGIVTVYKPPGVGRYQYSLATIH